MISINAGKSFDKNSTPFHDKKKKKNTHQSVSRRNETSSTWEKCLPTK
jgi:hypothetical protein